MTYDDELGRAYDIVGRRTAERDAAIARAEVAERERDEALAVIERAKARLSTDLYAEDDAHVSDTLTILETAPADALRERDAALMESLADSWENTDEDGPHVWNGEPALWLREKARERREGVA